MLFFENNASINNILPKTNTIYLVSNPQGLKVLFNTVKKSTNTYIQYMSCFNPTVLLFIISHHYSR